MERDANPYANERGEEPLGAPGAPLKSDLMKRVHPNGKLMHPELHPSHPDYRGPGSKPAAPPPPSSLLDGSSPWVILGFVILAAIWVYQRKGTPKRPQSTTVHADDLALLDKLRTGRALHEALEHSISKIEITPETAFGKAGVSFICDEVSCPWKKHSIRPNYLQCVRNSKDLQRITRCNQLQNKAAVECLNTQIKTMKRRNWEKLAMMMMA